MPNWCRNRLQIFGPTEDLQRFKQQAPGHNPWLTEEERRKQEPEPLNFHNFVPVPPEVLAAGYNDTGYHWELKHWGCRWGACHGMLLDEYDDQLIYEFDTAWEEPMEFLENVGLLWPSLTFVLDYEELGDAFKGLAKVHGEERVNHCLQL